MLIGISFFILIVIVFLGWKELNIYQRVHLVNPGNKDAANRLRRRIGGLSIIFWLMVLLLFFEKVESKFQSAYLSLLYLSICLLLVFGLIFLVIRDIKVTLESIIKSEAKMNDEQIQELEDEVKRLLVKQGGQQQKSSND